MTWTGEARLTLANRGGRTIAAEQYCRGALKVMHPSVGAGPATPRWTLVNPGGGFVDGDRYSVQIEVSEDAVAVVDAQSATKIYRCRRDRAQQNIAVTLGSHATLNLRPRPLIAYRDARYVQDMVVTMDPTATFVSREMVTAGWSPDGARFSYGALRLRQQVRFADGRLALVDNFVLEPDALDPCSPTVLAGHTHLGTLAVVAHGLPDVARIREVCAESRGAMGPETNCRCGVGGIPGTSVLVRCLGGSTQQVEHLLDTVETLLS